MSTLFQSKKKSPLSKQTDRGRVIHQVGTPRSQTEFQLFLLLPFQFDARLAHSSTMNLVAKNKVFEPRRNGRKSSKHNVTIVNFGVNFNLWFYSKWIATEHKIMALIFSLVKSFQKQNFVPNFQIYLSDIETSRKKNQIHWWC